MGPILGIGWGRSLPATAHEARVARSHVAEMRGHTALLALLASTASAQDDMGGMMGGGDMAGMMGGMVLGSALDGGWGGDDGGWD